MKYNRGSSKTNWVFQTNFLQWNFLKQVEKRVWDQHSSSGDFRLYWWIYIYIYTQFSTSQDGWMELMYTCMIFGWPHTSTKNCNRVTRRPFKLPSGGTYSDFPLLPLCFDGNPQMSHWNTTCINLVSELVLSLEQPGLDAKSFHAETSASSLAQSHIYTCSLLREQVQLHISKNTRIILSFSKIGILNLTAERKPHVHI